MIKDFYSSFLQRGWGGIWTFDLSVSHILVTALVAFRQMILMLFSCCTKCSKRTVSNQDVFSLKDIKSTLLLDWWGKGAKRSQVSSIQVKPRLLVFTLLLLLFIKVIKKDQTGEKCVLKLMSSLPLQSPMSGAQYRRTRGVAKRSSLHLPASYLAIPHPWEGYPTLVLFSPNCV